MKPRLPLDFMTLRAIADRVPLFVVWQKTPAETLAYAKQRHIDLPVELPHMFRTKKAAVETYNDALHAGFESKYFEYSVDELKAYVGKAAA